jgi:HK97 family phage portal protein
MSAVLTDPEGMQAWEKWLAPVHRKDIQVPTNTPNCPDPARSWNRFGLPSVAGDGFAWNREGWNSYVPNDRMVLQSSTVWACVRLLAEVMSTLPCKLFRNQTDGVRVLDTDHPLSTLLGDQPNPDMTSVEFWQILFAWMLLRGAAYTEKDYIGTKLVSLSPLFAPGLTWTYLNGERIYRYTDPLNGRQRIIPTQNIWRMPAFTLGGRDDMSPIAYGGRMFLGAMAADQASARFFEAGMMASGFVTMPDGVWLNEEQRDSMRESLDRFRGSRNLGGVFTLEGGAKYAPLTMSPEDAQMLATRSFNVEEICRWFRVPPTLVGHGDKTSNWGTGLEQQDLAFLKYSLRSWLKKAETSVKLNLMQPLERKVLTVEFIVEGLLRTDSESRSKFYDTMTRAGIFDRDYCRGLENLPPKGGNAGVLLVQSQNVPIDKVGQWQADPTGRQLIAIQGILEAVGNGEISPDSARAAIEAAIPILTSAQVDAIIAPTDEIEEEPALTPEAETNVQLTALNGPQLMALQQLLTAVANASLPPETASAMISAAFPLLTTEQIAAMINPLENFDPTTPPAAPVDDTGAPEDDPFAS